MDRLDERTLDIDARQTTAAPVADGWPERNQRWLAERFAFWRVRIARLASAPACADAAPQPTDFAAPDAPPTERANPGRPDDFMPAAIHVATLWALSAFERELLVVAAGIEIDSGLRSAVARAQGVAPERALGLDFALALACLPAPHWDAVSLQGPLRRGGLLQVDTSGGLAHAQWRIDERVLHHLTGVAAFDPALQGIAGFASTHWPDAQTAGAVSEAQDGPGARQANDLVQRIAQSLGQGRPDRLKDRLKDRFADRMADRTADAMVDRTVVLLAAAPDQRASAEGLAARAWQALGRRSLHIDASALPADEPGAAVELARRLDREAALSGAGLTLVLDPETGLGLAAQRLLAALGGPVLLVGTPTAAQLLRWGEPGLQRFNLPAVPSGLPAHCPAALQAAVHGAMQQFQVEPALLAQAIATVAAVGDPARAAQGLWDALREAARGGLDALAQRVDSRAGFGDLVLPAHALGQLRDIAGQLRLRHRVYTEWGFAGSGGRGLGIAALFAGDSGTGKTLAAEAIANEARLDLYRIDLASTVSKYIGETEKNLARLFDAAQASGAVLLFDEADALFGKRSDVKDSHDRYANIEVAYLLQRIESYRGLAILTTNLKGALDRAFLRRIRFVVNFPFPDAAARERIWRLQFPPQAPLAALDYAALGRLQLAGGDIRSVALNAAFIAAGRDEPIGDAALTEAVRAEFAKQERHPGEAQRGGAR
jgi:hypothetical protein